MLHSAVSFMAAVAAIGNQGPLTAPLSERLAELAAGSTMTVSQSGVLLGQAVIITETGYAITPGDVAFGADGRPRPLLSGALGSDRNIPIKVEAFDPVTDLALLRIPLTQGQRTRPAHLAENLSSTVVLAVLPAGPARAEVTRVGLSGVMGPGKRYMPLIEIRLEHSLTAMTGAPLFAPDGKLVGLVMASLRGEVSEPAMRSVAAGARPGAPLGPQPSVTAFSLDLPVIERVYSGYSSAERAVRHPWVGLFFSSAPGGGVKITDVVAGGPAARAGIRKDDVIVVAGGSDVQSHVDFASYLFRLRVGSTARLTLLRGGDRLNVSMTVGQDPQAAAATLRRAVGAEETRVGR